MEMELLVFCSKATIIIFLQFMFVRAAQLHIGACLSEPSLKIREGSADFILTGTVLDLIQYAPGKVGRLYKAQVAVKRVIKGHAAVLRPMSLILIENFGDTSICQAHVSKKDTKIFLLTANTETGNFRLNSSVIRLTLHNLDKFSALIRGYSFSTRAPVAEAPCEKHYCGPRSICKGDKSNSKAICTELQDPCLNRTCHYGAICAGNYLTGQSQCLCPPTCDAFPNIDMRHTYVCGSDNVTYENHCKLRLASCKVQKAITVESNGVCGGCQRKQCDFYSTCELDEKGMAKCVCPYTCSPVHKPVCGVDGITYQNECELRRTACEHRRFIVVAAPHPCESLPTNAISASTDYEPDGGDDWEDAGSGQGSTDAAVVRVACEEKICLPLGGHCLPANDDGMHCVCQFNCSLTTGRAVCGINSHEPHSSKRLFTNECLLKEHACQQGQQISSRPAAECEDVDILPCYGAEPLRNNITHQVLHCGERTKNDEKCPVGSYCHQSISGGFAQCCPEEKSRKSACAQTQYGCCPDGFTPAKGRHNQGCQTAPSASVTNEACRCNKLGAVSAQCDDETKQCKCKLGVGGARCDRCQRGFWGLHRAVSVSKGCMPCACSNFGSVRPDCEQMTGRCLCKPGVLGIKCDRCPDNMILQPAGCVSADSYPVQPSSCGELLCHLGAICVQRNGHVECVCNMTCKENDVSPSVCGSDGRTYSSVCQLRIHACQLQKDVTIVSWGSCGEAAGPAAAVATASSHFVTLTPLAVTLQADHDIKDIYKSNDLFHDTDSKAQSFQKLTTFGYLGHSCDRDSDCTVKHSACPRGKCTCIDGFEPLMDQQQCQKLKKSAFPKDAACGKKPCENAGTCVKSAKTGQASCACAPGFQGKFCEEATLTTIPSFGGKSFFELRPMSGYTQLNIELDFQAHALDGIILYNGQKSDGGGDFVSLSLNNGFVEFRYDLGDGPALIRSTSQVVIDKRHRITAKRFNQDGMLRLDDNPEVLGKCPGSRKFLDLDESLFIGYIPYSNPTVFDKIGTKSGFVGCIYSVRTGKKFLGLTDPGFQDTIAAFEIGECGVSACVSSPCKNGGTCEAISKGHQYTCICPHNFTGDQCEKAASVTATDQECKNCQTSAALALMDSEKIVHVCPDGSHALNCDPKSSRAPFVADFYGPSYIQLPRITDANPFLNIEIWFNTRSESGLLMYAARLLTGDGDFVAVNLRQTRLEFLFDLGDGIVNITYPEIVILNEWHTTKIFRHGKRASLQLDNGAIVSAESQGSLAELNLEMGTFIGGVKNFFQTARSAKLDSYFDGAVQMVNINGRQWDDLSQEAAEMNNVKPFSGPPCHEKEEKCLNGGLCIPRLSTFKCKCQPMFGGERCEKALAADFSKTLLQKAVRFDGHTFLEYPNLVTKSLDNQERNSFKFRVKTTSPNGLIVWQSKGKSIRGDFIAIAIVKGYVQFSYDLGKEQEFFAITSVILVNDGKWHTVAAERIKRWGSLQVDDETARTKTSSPGATALNTNGNIYIGGSTDLHQEIPASYHHGFEGCLEHFYIENQQLSLFSNSSNGLKACS
ncbi:agrin-like [Paramacrobiotus metropolitanus]|uniref:agrin-like n=1 Tax=Paramacrobiotus metropolitanus TaxID=2943436 RepID=UPI0024463131|nr:agrin-like [Paramacrobiotus metropolitanus]